MVISDSGIPDDAAKILKENRVAGYCAFFNVLSRQTQDDIIERTEQVL